MIKRIVLFLILILLCVLLCFVRPNLRSVQDLENNANKPSGKYVSVDISKYRSNPKEYFKIIEEKQNHNIHKTHHRKNKKMNDQKKSNFQ